MTIQARAYDNDSPAQTLTYKLYWAGSSTAMDTKTGTSGNTVTFTTKTGLAEYTTQTYSWRVEVTDSKSNPISANGTDRTYCSGKTIQCRDQKTINCTHCYGDKIMLDCSGNNVPQCRLLRYSSSTKCPDCGTTTGRAGLACETHFEVVYHDWGTVVNGFPCANCGKDLFGRVASGYKLGKTINCPYCGRFRD